MKYFLLFGLLFCFLVNRAQDRPMLRSKIEIPVLASRMAYHHRETQTGISIELLGQKLHRPLIADHYSLLSSYKKWSIPGGILTVVGGIVSGIGWALLPEDLPDGAKISSSVIVIGATIVATGITFLVIGSKYKQKKIKVKKGRVLLTVPEPDIMLPSVQNNYQSGLAVKFGMRF